MAIFSKGLTRSFGPKPWVNPLRKNVNFSTFWTSCLYSLERLFFAPDYRRSHCHGPYCLKKKVGKIAIFAPKPWVNPFGKMSIFRFFGLLVFIAKKGVFFALEYRKRHFSGLYFLKKKSWKNGHFWTKTPLEKCQFFDFLNFLFI